MKPSPRIESDEKRARKPEGSGRQLSRRVTVTKTVRCQYSLFLPRGYDGQQRWPLILFLHGAGERGHDLKLLKAHGIPKILDQHPGFPFIVAAPQCPADTSWSTDVPAALLDEIEENYRVDKHRIYVTGLSMGGYGTWQLALEYPRRFAAIAPICGWGNHMLVQRIKHLPIWTFHGAKDRVVPITRTREMVNPLRKLGGNVKFTVYPDATHDAWTRTYDNPRLYAWFLKHRRV